MLKEVVKFEVKSKLSLLPNMGNAESNESAAVKRQAEGFSNPMYRLLDLGVRFDNYNG